MEKAKSSPGWRGTVIAVGLLFALAGVGGLAILESSKPRPPVKPVVESGPGSMVLTTTREAAVVFTRAFWRHPSPSDRILHAERRELATATKDVRAWQWFLAVEPGPSLREWLTTNPFSLLPARALPVAPSGSRPAPAWFPHDARDYDLWVTPDGRFALLIAHGRNLIFATDSGTGFAPPVSAVP